MSEPWALWFVVVFERLLSRTLSGFFFNSGWRLERINWTFTKGWMWLYNYERQDYREALTLSRTRELF